MTNRLGLAHHFGWAVAVIASADHRVVDRRRIELIEPCVPAAPIHHAGGPHLLHRSAEPLDDIALAALVADVRASVGRATSVALDELAARRPNQSSRCRFERGRPISLRTSPSNVAFHTKAVPTRSCTARCWPNSHADAAGRFISTTQRPLKTKQPASWVSERKRCFTARGQRLALRGRRTIGWRSRQRSWSPDPPREDETALTRRWIVWRSRASIWRSSTPVWIVTNGSVRCSTTTSVGPRRPPWRSTTTPKTTCQRACTSPIGLGTARSATTEGRPRPLCAV